MHRQGRFERWGRGRYGGIRYGFRRARSRLYRSQILQVNIRWKALAEIYTMHSFAPFSNLNFFVKNCSVALHNSIATALDPTLDIAEGTFPVASAIDVWVRDPPAVSSLPARGA